MKKFGILFALSLFILIFSCSKDDNETPSEPVITAEQKRANLRATGASANDILSNVSFDKLRIQIAFVSGFRPTAQSITAFTDFLKQHSFKQNIEVEYIELDSPNEENLTLQEIADLENENRTAYNDGKTVAIYIYFADSPAEGDEEEEGLVTLGAVYQNTSMVIHEVTIRKLAARSAFITNTDVETATLNHEFGHLFGLVDLGTAMVNDHEDTEAANHCNVQGCLMRAELQFGGGSSGKSNALQAKIAYEDGVKAGCVLSGQTVLSLLQSTAGKGAATVDLDPQCILDIQGNGAR